MKVNPDAGGPDPIRKTTAQLKKEAEDAAYRAQIAAAAAKEAERLSRLAAEAYRRRKEADERGGFSEYA